MPRIKSKVIAKVTETQDMIRAAKLRIRDNDRAGALTLLSDADRVLDSVKVECQYIDNGGGHAVS